MGQMAAFEDHLTVSHRLSDAVFFAGCYNALLRHADRVPMAMIAGLVNVLAPIQTVGNRHHVTSAYLVGRLYQREARATSVPVAVDGPTLDVVPMADLDQALMLSSMARRRRSSPMVDASATVDGLGTTAFLSNRSLEDPARITVHGVVGASEAILRTVTGPHRFARNDVDHPDVLGCGEVAVTGGGADPHRRAPPVHGRHAVHHRRPSVSASGARPNIVLILCDDLGFSDIGCFGSEIPTPHLDDLATRGLRLTQMYNTRRGAVRAGHRSSTGLYPTQAGMGHMTETGTEAIPGYEGRINADTSTLAEALLAAGYRPAWSASGMWVAGAPGGRRTIRRGPRSPPTGASSGSSAR